MELRSSAIKEYEEDARRKNRYEKTKAESVVFRALEIIKPCHPNIEILETVNVVKEKIDELHQNFESEIDEILEKSRSLDMSKKVKDLYVNLYVFQPHNFDFFGKFLPDLKYSNRLFHTWHDERKKHLEVFKDIFELLGIAYDWKIPLVKHECLTECSSCNICRISNPNKK